MNKEDELTSLLFELKQTKGMAESYAKYCSTPQIVEDHLRYAKACQELITKIEEELNERRNKK